MQRAWMLNVGIGVATLLGLPGCQQPNGVSNSVPNTAYRTTDDMQMRWSMALRRLGVQPIFPLREDVQVGDIYFSRTQPAEENRQLTAYGFVPLDVMMASLNLNEEISQYYQTRYLFPETKSYNESNGYIDRSYFDACAARSSCDPRMMRLVTFPAFASINISRSLQDQNLYEFIPPETVSFLKGLGTWGQMSSMTIGTSMAESYAVPVDVAYRKFEKTLGATDLLATLVSRMQVVDGPPDCTNHKCYFYSKLITEVYAVRTMDIILTAKENNTLVDGYCSLNTDRLNKMLEQNKAAATSGGHIRFISYGPQGVTLRRTFARPVIIGYRGVLIRINALDNSSEMAGVIDSKPNLAFSKVDPNLPFPKGKGVSVQTP